MNNIYNNISYTQHTYSYPYTNTAQSTLSTTVLSAECTNQVSVHSCLCSRDDMHPTVCICSQIQDMSKVTEIRDGLYCSVSALSMCVGIWTDTHQHHTHKHTHTLQITDDLHNYVARVFSALSLERNTNRMFQSLFFCVHL